MDALGLLSLGQVRLELVSLAVDGKSTIGRFSRVAAGFDPDGLARLHHGAVQT